MAVALAPHRDVGDRVLNVQPGHNFLLVALSPVSEAGFRDPCSNGHVPTPTEPPEPTSLEALIDSVRIPYEQQTQEQVASKPNLDDSFSADAIGMGMPRLPG
jgi:hypothetical protein